MTASATPATPTPGVERTYPVPRLAADALIRADERAATLRDTARSLLAEAERVHTAAAAPVLQMLGLVEGNILDVREDAAHGSTITVRVPAPVPAPADTPALRLEADHEP